ncbi:OCTN [Mytilus edulis]|uniref:SLC22A4_5 n=1 Tax=Mytilus edulis TaxID=6550 RepID=A0A8S3VQB4_MYTED|nr:OCTN [Mytilus edulis]
MKFDDILSDVGDFGWYQKRNFILLIIGWTLTAPFMVLSVFVLAMPDHRCKLPGYDNDTYAIQSDTHQLLLDEYIPLSSDSEHLYDQCHVYEIDQYNTVFDNHSHPVNSSILKCSEWVYSSELFDYTFVMKENLVCDNKYKISLSKTIFFGGVLVGSFMFGIISDTFIPESPRWLCGKGKLKEATNLLRRAAKVNKTTFSEKMVDNLPIEKKEAGKVWLLFTDRTLGCRTLVIFYNWMVASMVFYGLTLNTDLQSLTTALAMLGKLFATAAFATIYIISAELFPTAIRNAGMGSSSLWARVGGMISPFIADTADLIGGTSGKAIPLVIFGAASLVAAGLTLTLPETLNRQLPETIEDGKNFTKKAYKEKEKAHELIIKEPQVSIITKL